MYLTINIINVLSVATSSECISMEIFQMDIIFASTSPVEIESVHNSTDKPIARNNRPIIFLFLDILNPSQRQAITTHNIK